jgi:hypothetical protein
MTPSPTGTLTPTNTLTPSPTLTPFPSNFPPIANDDSAVTIQNIPVTVFVLSNDSDPDGDPITITSVTNGTNGTVSTDGVSVTYTPNPTFIGNDSFVYTISDGNGGFASASVVVTVNP